MRYGVRAGQTNEEFGPEAVLANPLATPALAKASLTNVTFGQLGLGLSASAALTLSLANKLQAKARLNWFDLVRTDLEDQAYAVGALDLCAAGLGAPHLRQRLWWVADADRERCARQCIRLQSRRSSKGDNFETPGSGAPDSAVQTGIVNGFWGDAELVYCQDKKYRPFEPGTLPLAHGIANRMGRLRATGNALVAPVAEAFVRAYLDITNGQNKHS